jgi:dissimilatory sulfite reductase (desulfoviridin) alpha/beta subunit
VRQFERRLTAKELSTTKDRILMSVKEVAKKYGVSPSAITQRSDSVLFKTHSHTFKEAIYKLTKAGLLIITITTSLSTTTDNRLNNRRRAPTRPTISYRLDSVASSPA